MGVKHTPGPWLISQDHDYLIETKEQYSICRYHVSEITESQDLANARLIAAAPELLEVCKFILTIAKQGRPLIDSDLVALKEVICKATGDVE
jgi:hypothetical protein